MLTRGGSHANIRDAMARC